MGMGWITAFKAIPWGDVIAAAPTVAQGAKRLWNTVKSRSEEEAASAGSAGVDNRLHKLEERVSELERESAASSELIRSLAEQNARLVQAVEILRVRTRVLLALCFILSGAAIGLALWQLPG